MSETLPEPQLIGGMSEGGGRGHSSRVGTTPELNKGFIPGRMPLHTMSLSKVTGMGARSRRQIHPG